jgi:hypothetical protein
VVLRCFNACFMLSVVFFFFFSVLPFDTLYFYCHLGGWEKGSGLYKK